MIDKKIVMAKKRYTKTQAAKVKGYRSGLEVDLDESLKQKGIDGQYEQHKIKYVKPATNHTYTPDFRLPNGIFIETKGRFVADDRKKHILIKDQYPELDIRFVFQNSKNKLRKGSKTTYADWCIKYGFKYADKEIPMDWFK
jgi:Phage endonuclease I